MNVNLLYNDVVEVDATTYFSRSFQYLTAFPGKNEFIIYCSLKVS